MKIRSLNNNIHVMKQGSNTPARTRPVSLFVNSESKVGSGGGKVSGLAAGTTVGGVRRSNSMRKLEGE